MSQTRHLTMADASTATANSASRRVHPEGMDQEAGLLAQLAEVPLASKTWIRPLQGNDALISVCTPSQPQSKSHLALIKFVILPVQCLERWPVLWSHGCMNLLSSVLLKSMHAGSQVQYSQRNLAANAQRKYTVPYMFPANGGEAVPGFPMELKDVLLFSPSPSGISLLLSLPHHATLQFSTVFHAFYYTLCR